MCVTCAYVYIYIYIDYVYVCMYIYIYVDYVYVVCMYIYIYYISHMDSRNHQMAPVSTPPMGSHFWGLALRNPRRKVNGQVPHCERCSPHKLSAVASCPLSCCVFRRTKISHQLDTSSRTPSCCFIHLALCPSLFLWLRKFQS